MDTYVVGITSLNDHLELDMGRSCSDICAVVIVAVRIRKIVQVTPANYIVL